MRYKLVVSDLDATLLDPSSQVTADAIEAVGEFHRRGGLFTVATGRTEMSASQFTSPLGVHVPVISYNGGKITNLADGHVIYETFLDPKLGKEVYLAMRALGKDIVVYLDDMRYVAELSPVIQRYVAKIKHEVQLVGDIDRLIGDGRTLKKMLVIDPTREDDLIYGTIRRIFGELYNSFKSDPDYYEIMPHNTTKGLALTRLADYLGVPLAETVAIGDHQNDIPMIKAAGLGVAVANAEPEALAAADYVTTSNADGGVARVLRMIMDGSDFR